MRATLRCLGSEGSEDEGKVDRSFSGIVAKHSCRREGGNSFRRFGYQSRSLTLQDVMNSPALQL